MRRVLTGIKRFILWDYPRASWQYDLMVGLILAFLFLTPREWFNDQPRVPRITRVAMAQGVRGTTIYWLEAEVLAGVAPESRVAKAAERLQAEVGERGKIVGLEAVPDADGVIKGYVAFTHR